MPKPRPAQNVQATAAHNAQEPTTNSLGIQRPSGGGRLRDQISPNTNNKRRTISIGAFTNRSARKDSARSNRYQARLRVADCPASSGATLGFVWVDGHAVEPIRQPRHGCTDCFCFGAQQD